jgi:type VI secretion system secreted protein VgrG
VEQPPETDITNYSVLDDHGRYTIRFLFDTAPAGEHKASRPVRMIQPHAGPDYGMHFPLKPGIEVLLAFVNGDPDRPLIVGAVPNPETPSPVRKQNSMMNRIKTVSGILVEMNDL